MPRVPDLARNLGWKVAAVVLAYLFWLAIIEERQAIRQIEVPVRFENLDPALALLGNRLSSVIVRVQASEPIVKELEPTDVEARLDLSGLGEGTHVLRLDPESPSIIAKKVGMEVVGVFPPTLEVQLEPKLIADVKVEPAFAGRPALGFEVAQVRVDPPRVRIAGPQSAVQRTAEARTREVSLEGRRESFQQEVLVEVPDPAVLILSEPRARLSITLREGMGERTFSDLPLSALGGLYESRLQPHVVRITVEGPEVLLAQIAREDVVAYVEIEGLEPRAEAYSLPVKVVFTRDVLRERVRVKALSEPRIGVRVSKKKLG